MPTSFITCAGLVVAWRSGSALSGDRGGLCDPSAKRAQLHPDQRRCWELSPDHPQLGRPNRHRRFRRTAAPQPASDGDAALPYHGCNRPRTRQRRSGRRPACTRPIARGHGGADAADLGGSSCDLPCPEPPAPLSTSATTTSCAGFVRSECGHKALKPSREDLKVGLLEFLATRVREAGRSAPGLSAMASVPSCVPRS